MPRKFPKTREDGTFCVVARFTITQNAANLRDQINDWCKRWIEENNDTSGEPGVVGEGILKEPMDFFNAFTRSPYVIEAEDNQMWLRFDRVLGSYWWRDWLARILVALQRAYPELQPEGRLSFHCNE
jgi:hypothetical protein